jgi:hypothetical protein
MQSWSFSVPALPFPTFPGRAQFRSGTQKAGREPGLPQFAQHRLQDAAIVDVLELVSVSTRQISGTSFTVPSA